MADLPPIKVRELADALLNQAETLVPQWLPGGRFVPGSAQREYVCGSLAGGKGESCSVGTRNGKWKDFATGEAGLDLVSLYAAINELSNMKAAVQVAREYGLEDVAGLVKAPKGGAVAPKPARPVPPPAAKPQPEREVWEVLMPVPEHAQEVNFSHPHRQPDDIEHISTYARDGKIYGYAVRFKTSTDAKVVQIRTYCESKSKGGARWHWKVWPEPRPLFLANGMSPNGRTVIGVEGEWKAEVLQELLDEGAPGIYTVVGWSNGCGSWPKADWSWLAGSSVILWPDCDSHRVKPSVKEYKEAGESKEARAALEESKPYLPKEQQGGYKAMLGIGALLRDQHGCTVQMLPVEGPGVLPPGWDCKDAILKDGWDFARVQGYFAQAYALTAEASPSPAPAPPAAPPKPPKTDGPADADDGGGGGKPIPWWLEPYWDADKQRWLVSRKLVITTLVRDEGLQGVLGLNQLSNNIEARKPWPWKQGKPGPVTGAVDLLLGRYLSNTYGLPSINRAALMEAIETIAHENPFHPVQEYLQGVKWDGVKRIDKWLVYVMGEKPETLSKDRYEYLCLVGRYWLLGMVNRVMDPGCKFDYCPVLEGQGGLGKSTMVKTLASKAWFSDTHFDVSRGKEGQEQVQGLWVYEIAELAGFGKSEVQLIKAFISSDVDRYRPSYGRVVEKYPRQCVMVGTTNENTYLRDRTGNRRFWPLPVRHRINNPWIAKWRDQLFAEAFDLFLQGVAFSPTPEQEDRLFKPMQESRLVETAVMSELLHVLTRPPAASGLASTINELTDYVTIAQLVLALGVDAAKSNQALEGQIRAWMEHEGWERVKKQVNGHRAWGYARPKNWPPIEADEPAVDGAAGPADHNPTEDDESAPF